MYRRGKINHTEPFLINKETLKSLYDFILEYAENCTIEVVSFSKKGKEIREFSSYNEFMSLKHLILYKVSKLSLKGYEEQKEILSFVFSNPSKKILPFINPCTLKTTFSMHGEEEYNNFLLKYKDFIESITNYRRVAYTILYSFLPSFIAAILTSLYLLPFVKQEQGILTILLVLVFLFLVFSMVANLFVYPILYMHNPLVAYDFDIANKNNIRLYFSLVYNMLKENSSLLFVGIITGLTVLLFDKIILL